MTAMTTTMAMAAVIDMPATVIAVATIAPVGHGGYGDTPTGTAMHLVAVTVVISVTVAVAPIVRSDGVAIAVDHVAYAALAGRINVAARMPARPAPSRGRPSQWRLPWSWC